jgi:LEA14-like dessication related protein
MKEIRLMALLCCIVLILPGCAGKGREFEKPTVGLSSFRMLPSGDATPRFEIGLHIVNPNRSDLDLQGIFYTVSMDGHRVLAGATNNLPTIESYGEGDVLINATVDLMGSVILLSDLLSQPKDQYDVAFDAKLDVGDLFSDIIVHERGVFSFNNR